MRSVGIVLLVWGGIAVVAYVGLYGAIGGTTSLSVTPPDVMAALATAPLLVAAVFWPPWAVFFVTAITSPWVLETIMVEDEPIHFWPVAVSLLVIDGYSIWIAWQRSETRRQARARDAFEQIGRLAAEAPTLLDFADVVQERGVNLVGDGRLRLWVLNPERQELRMVATGDEAVIERAGRKGQAFADLPMLAVADAGPCACAARLEKIVAVRDRRANGPELSAIDAKAEQDGYHSVLAVPMLNHARLVGVLTFEPRTRNGHEFSDRERYAVQSIASLVAVAIEAIPDGSR
jgi:GAF domain-containing protein